MIWTILIILSIFQDISHNTGSFFGFGRGLAFFMVVSILLILYLIFHILVKLEELDLRITRLTRIMALKKLEKDKKSIIDKRRKKNYKIEVI